MKPHQHSHRRRGTGPSIGPCETPELPGPPGAAPEPFAPSGPPAHPEGARERGHPVVPRDPSLRLRRAPVTAQRR